MKRGHSTCNNTHTSIQNGFSGSSPTKQLQSPRQGQYWTRALNLPLQKTVQLPCESTKLEAPSLHGSWAAGRGEGHLPLLVLVQEAGWTPLSWGAQTQVLTLYSHSLHMDTATHTHRPAHIDRQTDPQTDRPPHTLLTHTHFALTKPPLSSTLDHTKAALPFSPSPRCCELPVAQCRSLPSPSYTYLRGAVLGPGRECGSMSLRASNGTGRGGCGGLR